jgi:hypothetical protein
VLKWVIAIPPCHSQRGSSLPFGLTNMAYKLDCNHEAQLFDSMRLRSYTHATKRRFVELLLNIKFALLSAINQCYRHFRLPSSVWWLVSLVPVDTPGLLAATVNSFFEKIGLFCPTYVRQQMSSKMGLKAAQKMRNHKVSAKHFANIEWVVICKL